MRPRSVLALLATVLAVLALSTACGDGREPRAADGDPAHGAELIASQGCGSCHQVPGVDGADGRVGPPLDGFAERTYIAGELTNTFDNLVQWIMDPQEIEPGTAMPDLGIDEEQARDLAAYLYTLRD